MWGEEKTTTAEMFPIDLISFILPLAGLGQVKKFEVLYITSPTITRSPSFTPSLRRDLFTPDASKTCWNLLRDSEYLFQNITAMRIHKYKKKQNSHL